MATAVPANNYTLAQEILRGVAQAQDEFNEKNGLNGRLLEMKIANSARTTVIEKLGNNNFVVNNTNTSTYPLQTKKVN